MPKKQDALQQLQAMDSAAPNAPPAVQPPSAEPSASQPSFYAADETSRRGLSQKAKAILILCAVSVLIIVIASVAVHSRKERTAGNGSGPAVGQTVYWQDGKYHSRPDCPLLDDEASVLERRYVDDEKHPRFLCLVLGSVRPSSPAHRTPVPVPAYSPVYLHHLSTCPCPLPWNVFLPLVKLLSKSIFIG